MKKGDVVKVYSDPVTCEDLEGTARIMYFYEPSVNPDTEPMRNSYCRVKFITPIEDKGFITDRFINPNNH